MRASILDRDGRPLTRWRHDWSAVHSEGPQWARIRNLTVRFVASEGAGSHGTLYAGDRKTTVKDRRKEIGKGLLAKMLADLDIDRDEFLTRQARDVPDQGERTHV